MEGINAEAAARGTKLMEQGEASLKRFSFFGMLSPSSKHEEALEHFSKAANSFKMAKDWERAAEAFERCAEMSAAIGTQHEAANYHVMAAEAYKKFDSSSASKEYRAAISIYCEMGRFSTAAKHLETLGEMYESENNLEEAVKCFKQAADFYMGENAKARANNNLKQVALLSATLGHYDVACQTFEDLGAQALESSLLTFGAKKHFLYAGICHLARGDAEGARQGLEKYAQMDFSFADSREGKLLSSLVEAYDKFSAEDFANVLYEYNQISPLNSWETSILLRVKNAIGEASEDVSDLQ